MAKAGKNPITVEKAKSKVEKARAALKKLDGSKARAKRTKQGRATETKTSTRYVNTIVGGNKQTRSAARKAAKSTKAGRASLRNTTETRGVRAAYREGLARGAGKTTGSGRVSGGAKREG